MKKEKEKPLLKEEEKDKSKFRRQKSKTKVDSGKTEKQFDKDEPRKQKSSAKETKEVSADAPNRTKEPNEANEASVLQGKVTKTIADKSLSKPQESQKPNTVAPVKKKRLLFSFRRSKASPAAASPARDKVFHAKSSSIEESSM